MKTISNLKFSTDSTVEEKGDSMTEFDDWTRKIAQSMCLRGISSCFAKEEMEAYAIPEMYREKLPEAVARRVEEMRQQ